MEIDIWTIVPAALIAPFITFFLGRMASNFDKKLNHRTYLMIDEIQANYKLKNYKHFKDGTKLILPDSFKPLELKLDQLIKSGNFTPSESKMNFLKIKPFGESIITSGWVQLYLKSTYNGEKWTVETNLPILGKNEEIFIAIDKVEYLTTEHLIEKIIIEYTTQANEKILYKSFRRKNKDNEILITESHSVKKYKLFYKKIQNSKTCNMEWLFLNSDNK